ncbi:MAG: energy-coupling factor ABC transporter permease [Clostridiales bacterium]|nr:energy-coupling factor ABC transporter permease [Clostridiales bacterium]
MHMADALLSPGVGGALYVASAAAVAYSAKKIQKDEPGQSKAPLMAVSGAMVFAAQMVNFTIPGTGSSGHIAGGILLAALLGPFAGLLALSAVLVIQCLCFADGGLLALGCNIFNIAVIPCLFVYPLFFRPILLASPAGSVSAKRIVDAPAGSVSAKRIVDAPEGSVSAKRTWAASAGSVSAKRIWAASVVSAIIALQLGSFGVVAETTASGVIELPFAAFALLMQPIHLAIGVVEGLVTAAILAFVHAARPELLARPEMLATPDAAAGGPSKSIRPVVITFAVIAAATALGLSLLASANPDGLEWSIEGVAGTTELEAGGPVFDFFASARERLSFMPDYSFGEGGVAGTPVAGIIGAVLVFALAGAAAITINIYKKRKRRIKPGEHHDL